MAKTIINNVLTQLFILVCILIIINAVVRMKINKTESVYVKSELNGKEYFVQNMPDKDEAAYILSVIDEKINIMKRYFAANVDRYPKYRKYIEQFLTKTNNLLLYENAIDSAYTSYTVNKGEETVLCLRSNHNGNLHDINLITYVTLHEMAHIACPELDHTDLFKDIFKFFITTAVNLGIYKNINYQIDPKEYCGLIINENLVK